MIHLSCLPDSIIAQKVSASAFSHSLDPKRKLLTLPEKLFTIGVKVVRHGRYIAFQLAEVGIPRTIFAAILPLMIICDQDPLRRRPGISTAR